MIMWPTQEKLARLRSTAAAIALAGFALGVGAAHADDPRSVIDEIQVSKEQEAASRLYALDAKMQLNYADTQRLIGEQQSPVILAMFNGSGGRYILRRNGKEEAVEPVPPTYEQVKSVSHTIVGIYEILAPYFANPETGNWRPKLTVFHQMLESGLATLHDVGLPDETEGHCRTILENGIAFTGQILDDGSFSAESFSAYAKTVLPSIKHNITLASKLQVDHFRDLVTEWREEMGEEEWSRLYALVGTAWAMRRQNVHFQILAEMMGRDAVNDRLIMAESIPDITEDQLIMLLGRIINDRGVGVLVFDSEYRMDVELMGEGARSETQALSTPHHPAMDMDWLPYEEHKMPNER